MKVDLHEAGEDAMMSASAAGQSWPQKPVKFIVPFAPGGATDISARMLGQKLTELFFLPIAARETT